VTTIQNKDTADYKIRMTVEGKDEISILSTGLNDMLSTIEKEITKWLFEGTIEQAKYLLQSVIQNMGDGLMWLMKTANLFGMLPVKE
jgi:signal transduction histidine kinase